MANEESRFKRRRPGDPVQVERVRANPNPVSVVGDLEALKPVRDSGVSDKGSLYIARLSNDGLLSSDLKTHALLGEMLYELTMIRLLLEEQGGGKGLGISMEEAHNVRK